MRVSALRSFAAAAGCSLDEHGELIPARVRLSRCGRFAISQDHRGWTVCPSLNDPQATAILAAAGFASSDVFPTFKQLRRALTPFIEIHDQARLTGTESPAEAVKAKKIEAGRWSVPEHDLVVVRQAPPGDCWVVQDRQGVLGQHPLQFDTLRDALAFISRELSR